MKVIVAARRVKVSADGHGVVSHAGMGMLRELADLTGLSAQVTAVLADAFHHPLIRSVAYDSQLKSRRSQIHRRVAAAIEVRGSADENAALIAEHLEAAGDLQSAFAWHMRAGTWSNFRDIAAAQTSWRRARQVADQLPDDDPQCMPMRIAPRTLLCGTA